jgi:hypothetical protein
MARLKPAPTENPHPASLLNIKCTRWDESVGAQSSPPRRGNDNYVSRSSSTLQPLTAHKAEVALTIEYHRRGWRDTVKTVSLGRFFLPECVLAPASIHHRRTRRERPKPDNAPAATLRVFPQFLSGGLEWRQRHHRARSMREQRPCRGCGKKRRWIVGPSGILIRHICQD